MKVSDFKKKQENAAKELERLAADLAGLKDQRDALSVEITNAIDADDFAKVEKLTAQQSGLDNKIRAAELIIGRKQETSAVSLVEIAAASNAEMMDFQKKINKAQNAADDALREYFRKVLDVAALVDQAWNVRADYIRLVPGIEDPTTTNVQTNDFDGVSGHIRPIQRTPETDKMLTEIRPDAWQLINSATRDRFNRWAGQDPLNKKEVRLG